MRAGRRAVRLAVLALAARGLVACGGETGSSAFVAPPVLVQRVEAHRLEERIEATGELRARDAATVAAQLAGQVTRVVHGEGDAVAAGQVVMEIDPEKRQLELADARARLAEARASFGESERELARMRKLHQEGVASDARLDAAETQLRLARSRRDAAVAQLGIAGRSLRDSSVAAPFAGLVSRRWVSEGEFVTLGAKLFDLVALDPIEVEFHLAERDSSRVARGAPVDVRVSPFPDQVFRAEVTVVSPTIDPATRTLRVKALLPNADGRLRPGLFARVDLGISLRQGVAMVPEEAVLQRADGSVAFRLADDSRAERRVLRLGVFREGLVEVSEGLAVGDVVVVRGHDQLVDGSPVSLRDAAGRLLEQPPASGAAGEAVSRAGAPEGPASP